MGRVPPLVRETVVRRFDSRQLDGHRRGLHASGIATQSLSGSGARGFIIEEPGLFADLLRATLERAGLAIVGMAADGNEVGAIAQARPDLVIVDIDLQAHSDLCSAGRILEQVPGVKIIALTGVKGAFVVRRVLERGLHGFVTKDMTRKQLVGSIVAALDGKLIIQHGATTHVRWRPGREAQFLAQHLTARERQVLRLVVEGMTSEEIARRLWISVHTVRTHVQSLLTKLQVHSRLEAATFAVRHGLIAANE